MSDYDTGDSGDTGAEYGHYEAGNEHDALDQLHQAHAHEADASSQFAVYEQDHAAAEHTDFAQGHHVESDNGAGAHAESDDYTTYNHDAAEQDHVFAAEGSEQSHESDLSELDALEQRFDAAFAQGTVIQTGDPAAELGPATG
jgi:hypothetical protein